MPDARTTITELGTGIGTLGFDNVEDAIRARPAEMVSVPPMLWSELERWQQTAAWRPAFEAAFMNGRAMLHATDGLRGRRPMSVDWRGTAKPIDDELVPADLRIDHVFLVSCKYLSKIVVNASPGRLFDGLLRVRTPSERASWFDVVAPDESARLLAAACSHVGVRVVEHVGDLLQDDRQRLHEGLRGSRWPERCQQEWRDLIAVVSERSAARWAEAAASRDDRLRLLWRLLRIGPTPYFVLGVGSRGPLRLRVLTSWDWTRRYRLNGLDLLSKAGGQPLVEWHASVRDADLAQDLEVRGHVEIRWSHGRLVGAPEAKVYLDTGHEDVPGYVALR